ncbi:MucBP domain-containing protein [Lactiplantibacillus plajomi]|uniref:MucBP domain-containing protein n=1 Tax=Lactiplantibacillus plajomi TaxID=1457217 RepID=A0ABV6K491_9LACO|nr:MucBP domain-containing protein [Lactiplantibacillus plajomi]
MKDATVHYKMYKSGKTWVIAGLTLTVLTFYSQTHVLAAGGTPVEAAVGMTKPTVDQQPVIAEVAPIEISDERRPQSNAQLTNQQPVSQATSQGSLTGSSAESAAPEATLPASDAAQTSQPASLASQATSAATSTPTSLHAQTSATATTSEPASTVAPASSGVADQPVSVVASERPSPNLPETAPDSLAPAAPTPIKAERTTPEVTEDINAWMPDKNLQYLVLCHLQKKGHKISATSEITREMVENMKDFFVNEAYQSKDKAYLDAVINIETLAGLQYVKNMDRFHFNISLNAYTKWGYELKNIRSKLRDISALKDQTELTHFILQFTSVSDVSVLKNMHKIRLFSMSRNFITDASVLSDELINKQGNSPMGYQNIKYPGVYVHVDPVTGKYVTTANIIGLDGKRVPVKVSSLATAKGHNLDDYTIEWDHLGDTGYFAMEWNAPATIAGVKGTPFHGNLIIPYKVSQAVGNAQVQFVDEAGNLIGQEINLHGELGKTQDLSQNAQVQTMLNDLKKKGLTLKEVRPGAQWQATDTVQKVTFVMETQKTSLTVTATDDAGNPVPKFPALDQKGEVGADWTITVPNVPGYELVAVNQGDQSLTVENGQVSGKFGDQYQTLTFNFKRKTGTVVVQFVNEAGQPLAESETVTGKFGEDYTVEPKPIQGFHLSKVNGHESGTFVDGELIVQYIYEVDEDLAAPGVPEEPGEPEEPGKPEVPGEPEEPGKPEVPGEPEKPGEPEEPSEPEQPGKPEKPGKPGQSEQPGEPEKPGQPQQPEAPQRPGQAGKPTPEKPERPTQPAPAEKPETGMQSGQSAPMEQAGQMTGSAQPAPTHHSVVAPQSTASTVHAQTVVTERPNTPERPVTAAATAHLPQTGEQAANWWQQLGLAPLGLTSAVWWFRKHH